jgi:hypothetical protein
LQKPFALNKSFTTLVLPLHFDFVNRMDKRMTDKETLSRALCGYNLNLVISNDSDRIFNQVDTFVALSEGNEAIRCVTLSPYDIDSGNYELWDKVGQGVGNLHSLGVLRIYLSNSLGEPDWEVLARILPHIQSKIELRIMGGVIEGIEEMPAFARAIHGNPAITQFVTITAGFSFESVATVCSALTTLPNLKSAVLEHQKLGSGEGIPTCLFPENMTEFLRAPSLRVMKFRRFCLTRSLCQAIALALKQGSSITSLNLHQCSFPEGGSEKIASALKENATLTTFTITPFVDSIHQEFYDAMARSLLFNSTLQDFSIRYLGITSPTSVCLSSLLLALGTNKTLRKLHISGFNSEGESLIPALHEGLRKNSTLEKLELIQSGSHVTEPAFRIAVVEALQLNKTLKTLILRFCTPKLTDDEVKHLMSAIKKNYGLESLPFLDSSDVRMGDLRSILRLNGAGRGYLLDGHGSIVSKGVGVLSAVNDDLNCVFLHLLENPSLCNRRH